jgi:hypothetical protein
LERSTTEQLLDMLSEDVGIEARRGRDSRELMHPIVRFRWKRLIPRAAASVQEVDVPCRARRLEDVAESIAQPAVGIPVLSSAGIWYQRHAGRHVLTLCAQLRYPDDKWRNRGAWLGRKDDLFDFERPSKTKPSGRADEQHDTNFVGIAIECRAERRAAVGDVGKCGARTSVRASRQNCRCTRSEKYSPLHSPSLVKEAIRCKDRRRKPERSSSPRDDPRNAETGGQRRRRGLRAALGRPIHLPEGQSEQRT